jgi:hypothetical protein
MRDIQTVMEWWGAWAANNQDGLDYSSIAAGFKGLLPATRRSRSSCCDSAGLIINTVMAMLKNNDPYLHQLIIGYYVIHLPVRSLGYKLGISHTLVLKRLQVAEGFIDGCLAMADVTLEMDRYCQKENIYQPKKNVVEFQK